MKNELGRALSLVADWKTSGETRARFARRRRIHPSALSRILRIAELPPEVLAELETLPRLSRTHLEVIATAPAERRPALVEAVRSGRSTYSMRERRETTAVALTRTVSDGPAAATSTGAISTQATSTDAISTQATSTDPASTHAASTSPGTSAPGAPTGLEPAPRPAPPAPELSPALAEIARTLGASPEEVVAFASELLSVLWRSGRDRVEASFGAFRAAHVQPSR